MKKSTIALVAITIILAAATAILAYQLVEQKAGYESALAGAQADIDGMNKAIEALSAEIPTIGESSDNVVFIAAESKVFYSTDSAYAGRDCIGSLINFLPELAEKNVLVYYNGNIIGVKYLPDASSTSESSSVYAVAGGLYILQAEAEG